FSLASQTKNKATSEVWKPFWAPNLAHFYGLILQRALSQKCKHFFEEMQPAASHFLEAPNKPPLLGLFGAPTRTLAV
ncbi:hypothetical protein, partial [Intestinimonas butyriciproducens]|uniref:hypothetical protein n=1 Tax=Intestinimonas butyriciproducens TaxID=1297617 RepID=UPI00195ED72C